MSTSFITRDIIAPIAYEQLHSLVIVPFYFVGADDSENKAAVKKLEDGSKHAKLVVRKPTEYLKAQPKMAPMKATAPIQNMTRVKCEI